MRSAPLFWLSGWCWMGAVSSAFESRPIPVAILAVLGIGVFYLARGARFAEEHALLRGKIDCQHCLGWRKFGTDLSEQCPVCEVVRDAYADPLDDVYRIYPHRMY